jgi:hypothetical protein
VPPQLLGADAVAADADGECKRSERSREPMPHIDVGDKVV